MTSEIRPFHVDIPQAQLDDLAARLANTRWPDQPTGLGWRLGAPVDYVRELAEYWRRDFDWRAREQWLNGFPQFTTTIDGANVHFAHLRSPEPDAVPLLLTHGWPGSFVEFLGIAGALADPRAHDGDPADAFHVVVPSIPGFGFSGAPSDPDWGPERVADAFAELMSGLGYERFCAHGGDWGAIITRQLAVRHPERLHGAHLTTMLGAVAKTPADLEGLTGDERARAELSLARFGRFTRDGMGHVFIQGTRAQTLSYGLTDSPAGQLAWIAEKFRTFSNVDADSADVVDRDTLLTNVAIYWFTATANSSARIYQSALAAVGAQPPSTVPTALAHFPDDTTLPVRALAERTDRIVRWTEFDRGGHFPGLEQPDLLLGDLRAFFGEVARR
ncbi:epoxide hydrolase family protein [Amycolatopsis sp. NPDC059027]|uniref:epoxide hydrolase family protein n=1 Tax=Amycolatopsis sp. NPDC059027 TaxID=3346709 RepID=UPI0036724BBB